MAFPEDPRGGLKYHASKILAHRSTLNWASAQNPSFRIITLHPSFVFGRNMLQTSAGGLDGTNAMLWACLHAPKPLIPMTAVDVRDVAAAHVAALHLPTSEEGDVEEFILSAGPKEHWTWEQVADFARSRYPALGVKLEGPFDAPPEMETQRAERMLGLKWRGMEDTVGEFLDQQVELRGVYV
jgi:nucleoside-diphosphate-sugar epimerase